MRVAIIAALPGELKPLVKGWKKVSDTGPNVSLWLRPTKDTDEVFAVCAGMGGEAARRAFAAVEARGALDLVLSVGWAGALDPRLLPGQGAFFSEVIDAQTGERFALAHGESNLRLVTTARVADAAEKKRLASAYGAVMVDMEAAAIARLARMRSIPMVCLKAVSDEADASLPDMNPFIDRAGQMRMAAFVAHVPVRPWFWVSLLRLGANSTRAARELARQLEVFLAAKDWKRPTDQA